jgi:tight adherence protein B
MSSLFRFVAALTAGAAVFLLWNAAVYVLMRSQAPRVALAQADIAAQPSPFTKTGLQRRIRHFLAVRGYQGSLAPVAIAVLLLLAVSATLLSVLGVNGPLALVGAVVGAIAGGWMSTSVMAGRRKAAFDRQLQQAISMLVGQVESGNSVEKGLRIVAAASSEPLRSEFLAADAAATATRDLAGALAEVAERYPSRAMTLFVTAIEMTAKEGSSVAPALRTAARILQQDFELNSEAKAEVAQSRYEYYGILAIVGFIGWTMVFGNSATSEAFSTPVGIIALILGCGWMGLGVFRISNMLRKAERGDTPKASKRRADSGPQEVIR